MTLNDRIIEHLKLREGERLTAYEDTLGYLTVGVGHKVLVSDKIKLGQKITKKRSDQFLADDMTDAFDAAVDQLSGMNLPLTHQEMEDFLLALTSVNFQLGTGWPEKFWGSYPKLVSGDWKGAIEGFKRSAWAKQTPVRVEDFVNAIEKVYTAHEFSKPKGEEKMTLDLNLLNGYKTHILGAFAILVGVVKILADIPEIEVINVLGVSDAWTLITTGWATIAGRSVVSKIGE